MVINLAGRAELLNQTVFHHGNAVAQGHGLDLVVRHIHGGGLGATSRRALVGGEPLELSGREWTLLDLLVTQRDKVVTKESITQAWGADGGEVGGGNSIEVYIHRLRRKLEDAGLVIRTVRGLGYKLQ